MSKAALLETEISRFSGLLRFEKRYSPHTVKSYLSDLQSFMAFLAEGFGIVAISEITPALVRSWLADLKEKGLSSRSIVRKISTLQSFFKFCLREGIVDKSPLMNVSTPKTSRKLPTYVEEKDMGTLLAHVEFPDDWGGRTDRLAIQMLYQLGLRLSELIGCREAQVDFSNAQVRVLGKGSKERLIPAGSALLNEISGYLKQKKEKFGGGADEQLLVGDKGRKLYPKYVYRLTKKYLGLVTTVGKRSPHVLRHSFATHLSNNGAELNAVKDLLGHASLAATQVYTHNTIGKLKNVHRKAHPRG